MTKLIYDIMRIFSVAVLVVLSVERPGEGSQKRQEAVEKITALINEPGGISIPGVFSAHTEWVVGLAVDLAVKTLNRNGWKAPEA